MTATQIYGAVPATLTPGVVQSFSLRAKPSAILPVYCPSQSTAHLIVEQIAGDAVVTIGFGHGTPRVVDAFDFGPESLTIICALHGDTSIRVGSAAPGEPVSYTVRYERVDRTTPVDHDRETAEDLSTQSKLLLSTSGDWDRAVSLSREALEKWQWLQDTSAIARTYLKIGDLFFARANWVEAAKYYGDAVSECRDSRCLAEAHNNAGLVALNRGDAEQSLKEFQAARDGWHELGFQSGEATTSMNLGLLYWHMSDWQSALREDARAREIVKSQDSLRYARSLNNIGLVYMSMADYPKAALYFRMAMAQLPQAVGTLADRGRMWMNLGRSQMFDGGLNVALGAARRAVSILVSIRDQDGTADAWNNVGQILLKLGKRVEAEQALNRALPVYETLGDVRGNASVLHYLGQAAFQRKDYDEADAKLQKALAMRLERRLTDDAAETIALLASVARSRGDIETALNLIQRSLALVEEVRSRFVGEPLRRAYFANKQRYRDFYIETLLGHDDAAAASQQLIDHSFDAIEQARARALVDLLGEDRMVSRLGAQTELRLRQQAIRRDLNFNSYNLAKLRETSENAAAINGLRTEIDKALAEDSEVDSLIRSSSPDKIAATDPPPITIGDLRGRVLSSDDTLFEFALGEKRSFLWIVTQGGVRLSVLPSRSNIERKTSELLALLTDIRGRQADADKEKRFQLLRRELARMLGFDAWQAGKTARIIVVPDGLLHRLPFTILRIRTSGSAASADLGLIAEVMQCQSATVYKILGDRRDQTRQVKTKVLAFGDPVYMVGDSRLPATPPNPAKANAFSSGFMRLPFSQDELNAVAHLVPQERRQIVRGLDATRNAFIRMQMDDYSLVLISSHAFADDRQPELSSLVFSLRDRKGQSIDGYLRLYELYDKRISPAFVILSACDTAAGKAVKGEGLIGLARGFQYAGASGLLATLFRVDDEASSEFVINVLNQLLGAQPKSPAAAVLRARRLLAASTRWNDPFYWGAFVLMSAER